MDRVTGRAKGQMLKDYVLWRRGKEVDIAKRDAKAMKSALQPFGVADTAMIEENPTKEKYE